MPDPERLDFRASSYSNGANGCVEPAPHVAGITVRDSKHKNGPRLQFSHDEWSSFLSEVLAGTTQCANGAVTITTEPLVLVYGGTPVTTTWHLHAVDSEVVLHFTEQERRAFELGIGDHEFDFAESAVAHSAA